MIPKRIAQTLDGDGKPTVRNLAEALETLTHLGCDVDAGRIWFEVIPEASSPAVSASLFYSTEQESVDVRLVLPLLRGFKGRTEFGGPLHLPLEVLHLAKVDGRSARSSATLTNGTSVYSLKFDIVQFSTRWTDLEEAIVWLTIKAFKAEHIFLRRHVLARRDDLNSALEYQVVGIDYSILHTMRESNVKNLTGYINDHIGELPRGNGQPKFGPVSEDKVQQTLNMAGISKVRGPKRRRAA